MPVVTTPRSAFRNASVCAVATCRGTSEVKVRGERGGGKEEYDAPCGKG